MEIGRCTCPQGMDGSPCSHQAAITLNFGSPSVNCIPTLDPEGKRKLAYIAYGADAIQDLSFYCTLSQSWGKAVAAPGHMPKAAFTKQLPKDNSNYFIPLRPHNSSIKRPHSLKQNILKDSRMLESGDCSTLT